MRKQNFISYDKKRSIKINLITSGIYILLTVLGSGFIDLISDIEQRKLSGTDYPGVVFLAMLVIMMLLLLITLIMYSVFLPLFLKLHSNYIDNVKNLIGILICNGSVALFFIRFAKFKFVLSYVLIVILGLFLTLTLKYNLIKKKIVSN